MKGLHLGLLCSQADNLALSREQLAATCSSAEDKSFFEQEHRSCAFQ